MSKFVDDVRAMHVLLGIPILYKPRFPASDRVELRLDLVREEYFELLDGISERDIVKVADGIADSIYVLIGMAHEFGIPIDKVWDEVQRTNMAKRDPVTGEIRRREDGKVLKPEGWTPPDIARIIKEAA